jgi:SAM-dependent methyltransferase
MSDAPAEFARVLREKVETARWALELPGDPPGGDHVEIGIGPLGVGCAHFVPRPDEQLVVGVEPLPLVAEDDVRLPEPLGAVVRTCRAARYVHVCATGEETGLEDGRFAQAFCYNVLDHVRDPEAVVREVHRILRPGGRLVLACDALSLFSDLRFNVYVKRRHHESIYVRAHTFRFRAGELPRLLEHAGFRVIAKQERRPRWAHELAGHAQRVLLAGEK